MAGVGFYSKYRIFRLGAWIFVLLVLTNCKSARPLAPSKTESVPVTENRVPKSEAESALRLSASFEILSDDLADINKLKGLLRLQKDSLIWINLVHPGGIPVARGLFTPDSFFVQNRIDKENFSGSYADFYARYKLPLDFSILQSVLLGEMIPDLQVAAVQEKSDSLSLVAGFGPAGSPHFSYLNQTKPISCLKQTIILFQDKILEVNYENPLPEQLNFPLNHQFSIKEPMKTQNIQLNFSKIETNVDLVFPFQKQN